MMNFLSNFYNQLFTQVNYHFGIKVKFFDMSPAMLHPNVNLNIVIIEYEIYPNVQFSFLT